MQETKLRLDNLSEEFKRLKTKLNLEDKRLALTKLEAISTDPDFWNDQKKAKAIMQEIGDLTNDLEATRKLEEGIETLFQLTSEAVSDADLEQNIADLEKLLAKIKLQSFLSGPYDARNALFTIHAGQGGVEAMDWVGMLYRMYLRFLEKRGWVSETVDVSEGEEAGIKSITFKVLGKYAYGYLKGEVGTHRLVRQSPFNADKLRQTSFALVGVLPELSDADLPDLEIKNEDLDWQFFRSSSQGGQNVQKVSTAVRLIHKPTGITVTAQSQRFQEQNRKIAMELLRAKLWLLQEERKKTQVKEIKGEYRPASWGNQIRSYVLHPYKMVKDLRTQVETSNSEAVLNGELDEFIEAELSLASSSVK